MSVNVVNNINVDGVNKGEDEKPSLSDAQKSNLNIDILKLLKCGENNFTITINCETKPEIVERIIEQAIEPNKFKCDDFVKILMKYTKVDNMDNDIDKNIDNIVPVKENIDELKAGKFNDKSYAVVKYMTDDMAECKERILIDIIKETYINLGCPEKEEVGSASTLLFGKKRKRSIKRKFGKSKNKKLKSKRRRRSKK